METFTTSEPPSLLQVPRSASSSSLDSFAGEHAHEGENENIDSSAVAKPKRPRGRRGGRKHRKKDKKDTFLEDLVNGFPTPVLRTLAGETKAAPLSLPSLVGPSLGLLGRVPAPFAPHAPLGMPAPLDTAQAAQTQLLLAQQAAFLKAQQAPRAIPAPAHPQQHQQQQQQLLASLLAQQQQQQQQAQVLAQLHLFGLGGSASQAAARPTPTAFPVQSFPGGGPAPAGPGGFPVQSFPGMQAPLRPHPAYEGVGLSPSDAYAIRPKGLMLLGPQSGAEAFLGPSVGPVEAQAQARAEDADLSMELEKYRALLNLPPDTSREQLIGILQVLVG